MKYVFILLLFPAFAFSQQRLYVNATATGGNTGTSWADAHPDLQTALQGANKGDTVWVARGTYRPTVTTNRRISFELPSGVHLFYKQQELRLRVVYFRKGGEAIVERYCI